MDEKDVFDVEVVGVEVVDDYDEEIKPVSAVEKLIHITGYNDLVRKVSALNIEDNIGFGDGKAYDSNLGQSIWKNQVVVAKPVVATTQAQQDRLESIYKFVFHCVQTGEYPLMQMLCNYLGTTLDELILSLTDIHDPFREINVWVYKLFESTANMNALKSNGSFAARKWLDESREHRVSAETKLTTAVEMKRIDVLKELGEDLYAEFMIEED